jgi:uncharacterized protein YukE
MDIFLNFPSLEGSLNQFKQNSQTYSDCFQGIQQIASMFEDGGFMGECGNMFNDLLQRDMGVIQEFADIYNMAAGLLGDTISEFQNTDESMNAQIPT